MAYDPAANTWSNPVTSTQTDTLSPGNRHNAAEYSPTHRATIFGGGNDPAGSAGLGMVDSNGSFSALGNAPNTFGPSNNGILSVDPVSGDFLFLNAAGGLYKHNFATDTWANTGTTVPSILMARAGQSSWNVVVTPIHNYNVLMFCTHNATGTSGQIYLHKVIQ